MAVEDVSEKDVALEDRFDYFRGLRGEWVEEPNSRGQRLTRKRAAVHDMKQRRRHSSWSPTDWQKLSYRYMTAFGSAIKGLE